MDKKPFSITPGLAKNALVYVFSYSGTEADFDTDKDAYFTELKKHFLYDQTVAIYEFGLGLTGSTEITVTGNCRRSTRRSPGMSAGRFSAFSTSNTY